MLSLLSPAKSLDFTSPALAAHTSQPDFLAEAQELIEKLRTLAPQDLSQLMKISDKLAGLNAARYQQWSTPFTQENAKQAVFAFTGDVYSGLDAGSLSSDALAFGQAHLRILSGLYGLLRPLDLIQPYRLEMGTSLANSRGSNLYAFWQEQLTREVNQLLAQQKTPLLLNLASQEYFKAINSKQLKAQVITPVFKDWKNGNYKVISFYAKKARGLMSRFILENGLEEPEDLKAFDLVGYAYQDSLSDANNWVFTRKKAD